MTQVLPKDNAVSFSHQAAEETVQDCGPRLHNVRAGRHGHEAHQHTVTQADQVPGLRCDPRNHHKLDQQAGGCRRDVALAYGMSLTC
jgi:hypothetical protein